MNGMRQVLHQCLPFPRIAMIPVQPSPEKYSSLLSYIIVGAGVEWMRCGDPCGRPRSAGRYVLRKVDIVDEVWAHAVALGELSGSFIYAHHRTWRCGSHGARNGAHPHRIPGC